MLERLMRMIKRTPETRASGAGYTAQVMDARDSFITGRRGLAELTATAQGCVSLWEGGLAQAEVIGADLLTPETLGITARSLGLRGEAVYLIRDRLIPASDWEVTTSNGKPTAYQLTISEAGGGRHVTALAGEVFHVKVGADAITPWAGVSPLRRAQLTAELLHAVEEALTETFQCAPLGSQITPMPENPEVDNDRLARSFRGQRGRVLLRESVNVTAAGGPTPVTDWKPSDLSPDLSRSMTAETLEAARSAICHAFGVLPALMDPKTTGPLVREAQRHLAQWQLQPVARLIADEATAKLGATVAIDTLRPLQAYDAGGRARALTGVLEGLAAARESGLPEDQIAAALKFAGVLAEPE
ncbi:phage portal protein [Spectribacter hydrogenooxidans]|uniref:Phage portal protein n=1 Tax=Spectribacter hydrogenoxidans TaxID=3075608 RepID=A0ABU3C0H4_9GAMM|nr:phage portal protein [Salinisphaera sp. W335]MDT0635051.1 phage portal protein [Salinisphaera sp. W335]